MVVTVEISDTELSEAEISAREASIRRIGEEFMMRRLLGSATEDVVEPPTDEDSTSG